MQSQPNAMRTGLRDGWDSLVRVMFAPCAGDVGGVPREDVGVAPSPLDLARSSCGGGGGGNNNNKSKGSPSWGASVPFEVSASSQDKSSSLRASSFATQITAQDANKDESNVSNPPAATTQQPMQQHTPPRHPAQTPREQREARSRARLRKLGARHQLASGLSGHGIADAARPVSPRETEEERRAAAGGSPDLVDFDDGISAISSHTLEEMERRRTARAKEAKPREEATSNIVHVNPLDFSQIIQENVELQKGRKGEVIPVPEETEEAAEEEKEEEVFGEPFYAEELYDHVRTVNDSKDNQHLEFSPAANLKRVTTHQTQNTTVTEDSHEFEEMYLRQEAMYWTDQDQVEHTEKNARSTRRRPSQRASVEERARRLRELSRSRSRSDGTGSSNKSGTSSLVSGQHPHDTVPVFSSDLFGRRKKSAGSPKTRRSSKLDGFVPGSRIASRHLEEGSDPFAALDYGEI